MTDKEKTNRGYNWPELAAFAFSLIAIVISGYSLLEGRWQHRDERNTEVLDFVYDDWGKLAESDDWRVQHLLEAPDTYYAIRDLARKLTRDFDDKQVAETLLVERSMANRIFTNFEHHLKQWMLAVELGDESRKKVLFEEIEFYAEVQLRNPRLLWFWSADGGGWVSGADPSSVRWYQDNVTGNPDVPLTVEPDAQGITPGFEWNSP